MFKALLLTLTAAVAVIGSLSLVSAHNRPVRFDPAPGAVLETAPDEVTGWFAGPLRRDPNWTHLQVLDAEDNRVDTDEVVLSEDRRQMTVELESGLEPGAYTVKWSSWDDDDGFILGDCFKFYVGQEAADAAIEEGTRLLGGEGCEVGVSATQGTPTPEELTPEAENDEASESAANGGGEDEANGDDDSNGVPVWLFALGIGGGLVLGGVGGRLVGGRS